MVVRIICPQRHNYRSGGIYNSDTLLRIENEYYLVLGEAAASASGRRNGCSMGY